MILTTTFFATGLHSSKQQLMQLFSVTRVGAILCWLMLSCSHVASANASSDIQGIIDNSIAAYGADNLTKLRSLRLEDTLYQFSQGQSGKGTARLDSSCAGCHRH